MLELAPILLIDDDEDDFELIAAAYQQTGCQHPLKWFDKPCDALDFIKQLTEPPLMIIADISMPMIDGLEFRKLMREAKVHTLTAVPFYYLTTSNDPKLMRQGYELLVQGYFIKPNTFSDLVGIVSFMVQQSLAALDALKSDGE